MHSLRAHLNRKQLFLVIPFIKRLRFVQTFIALHSHELAPERLCRDLGDLSLANARGAFDQKRSAQLHRDQKRDRKRLVRDIVFRDQSIAQLFQSVHSATSEIFYTYYKPKKPGS